MELLRMKSESVVPRKRPLEDSNDFKYRRMVPAVRDFPPGFGINEEGERKPLKVLTKAHSDLGKMSFDGDDELVDSNCVENDRLDSSNKAKELGRNKSYVVSRPVGKVKFWDPTGTKTGSDQKPKVTIRSISHGPQKKSINTKVTVTHGLQGKNINNVDSNVKKMTPDAMDKLVNSRPVENSNKVKTFEPKELGRSKSYLGARSTAKVKFWDPTCEVKKSEDRDTTIIVSQKEQKRREKIQEALDMFDKVYDPFYQENRVKQKSEKIPSWRIPMEVARIVKQKLKWMDPEKIVGPVCGVEIGDKFKYRSLLVMIGLHSQPHSGIDYANIEGKNLAISIVDSHRYSNESGSSDTLVYSGQGGQGGLGLFGSKSSPKDQTLERGNLAMKNSMDKKSPVRVIRKVVSFGKDVFVYDGLYLVDHYTDKKGAEGKIVFGFHLKRIPGQPSLHNMMKW